MDKTMFKGYVRELVREMVKEEVARVLPEVIEEAMTKSGGVIKESAPSTRAPGRVGTPPSRERMAEMLNLTPFKKIGGSDDDDIGYSAPGPIMPTPIGVENNAVLAATVKAINRDYSGMFKKK